MTRRRLIFARITVMLFFLAAFFSRCASVMTPEGGPKDTIPPVIIRLTPDNNMTNFKEKRIFIEFNEYVQLKDQNKEMYTSPAMKKQPQLTIKGRGIQITIKDTLKENTTYAIDLGSAVRDNNEGNPLNAMRYVFSTGDKVDSMVCSGYTADSYKADSVSRTFIWFFIADSLPSTPGYDSTIFNRKPDVISRAQNNGIFIAQNLKPINYRIYAFGDKNDNQMYEPGTDMIGFIDSVYNPATLPDFSIWFDSLRMYPTAEPQLYFRMFTDEAFKGQRLVEFNRTERKKIVMYFNTAHPKIEELKLDSIPSDKILYDPRTIGKDTVNLWLNLPEENIPDTIRGSITYFKHDSIRQYVRTTEPLKAAFTYVESKEEAAERKKEEKARAKAEKEGREYTPTEKPSLMKFQFTVQPEVNPELGFDFDIPYPAVRMDSTEIRLTILNEESKTETPARFTMKRDTMNMCSWHVDSDWRRGSKYRFYLPKKAVADVMGYENDSTVVEFTTMDPDKYATLVINVKGEKGKRYIIQQTDTGGKMQKEVRNVTDGKYQINYIAVGDIKIRIIEDSNCNGKWDSGNVVKGIQPERSELYVNSDGEEVFAAKANWEIDLDIDMSRIFIEMDMAAVQKMLDNKEAARLKKLREDLVKRRAEMHGKGQNGQNSSGSGFGGFGNAVGGLKNKVSGTVGSAN